jgi:hypothetical protein
MSFLEKRRLPITIAAVLLATIAGGVLHGRLSQRWGAPPDLVALAAKFDKLPADIGPWRLESSGDLEPEVQKVLQCAGHVKRTYIHANTGEVVTVAVMLGPHGPIAVHTPEICYSSRDFAIAKPRERIELPATGSAKNELWSMNFNSREVTGGQLSVWYAWTTGNGWVASESPRFEFSGEPWLYKIQVASQVNSSPSVAAKDPCREFLEAFLPVLQACLPDES